MSDDDELNVDAAYKLKSPEDNKNLYRAWADNYDETFAAATGYLFPGHVARLFARRGGSEPIVLKNSYLIEA